jgi:hypothetical protein
VRPAHLAIQVLRKAVNSSVPGGSFFPRRSTWAMTLSNSPPFFSYTIIKLFDGATWVRISRVPTSVGSVEMQNSSHILTHWQEFEIVS